ncbi:MAG: endo-1,4-beta-xylanase [Alphaproteobacteria bacterium]
MLSRRDTFLAALASIGAAAPLRELMAQPAPRPVAGLPATSIRPKWSVPFGTCVRPGPLDTDPGYRQALLHWCDQLVPEGDLIWAVTRPRPDAFVFDIADKILNFARDNGKEQRGHTLVWYGAMPEWTKQIRSAREAESEMIRHIETVMGRYRGRIKRWNVVNEPIADNPASRLDLRPSMWVSTLGEAYTSLAFRTAQAVDPACKLEIGEYDIEGTDVRSRRRREAFLRIIRDMRGRGVPFHTVGLQAHLRGDIPIDKDAVSAFCAEMRSMGLEVIISELDVIDEKLPADIAMRDALVASRAYDFLDAVHAGTRPVATLSWGISDPHTWVPMWFKRKDGLVNRPLPLDAEFRPKPLMRVIEHFGLARA